VKDCLPGKIKLLMITTHIGRFPTLELDFDICANVVSI